ncbi:aspartyl protease family protein [Luteibacter sp. CQ10]|uniref:aspartyl protease family protein n=1 Tax=Luteibacter sp. CQ10 TaxID=2805821 RepID=UPI0034A5905E
MPASALTLALAIAIDAAASSSSAQVDACEFARHPPPAAMSIPFDMVDGRVYVQARVDGKGPFRFAVDTGASGIGRLDRSLLDALHLQTSGRMDHSDGVRTATEETTRLASLALGGFVKKDVDVITRDYKRHAANGASFDGILARGFFADGVLSIDYSARKLTFSTDASLADHDTLHYDRAFRVPIRVHGDVLQANLDTGANVAMVVPRALWPTVSNTPLEPAGQARLSNSSIAWDRGVVDGPVTVGSLSLSRVEARVSDRYPEILLGAHALKDTTLVIDQRSQRIALCPSSS